jgi:murein DD-endopeptidase MepM/ murein hydrolase activator NlpD
MIRKAAVALVSFILLAMPVVPATVQAGGSPQTVAMRAAAMHADAVRKITIRTQPAAPGPGDVLIVRASGDVAQVAGQWGDRVIHFAPDGARVAVSDTRFIALVGLDALLVPGAYSLTITATAADGTSTQTIQSIKIRPRASVLERVTLTKTLSATLDPALNAEEASVFAQIYAGFSEDKRWTGPLKWPVAGKVVSGYGNRRAYNGVNLGTYHTGYDLRAGKGTPVKAAAAGQVAVVHLFDIHGLTVVINHGRGVFTTYSHLSKASVAQGQTVQTGDVVGQVGSTGRSQGPHLHFELAVGGATVDPGYWTRVALP